MLKIEPSEACIFELRAALRYIRALIEDETSTFAEIHKVADEAIFNSYMDKEDPDAKN